MMRLVLAAAALGLTAVAHAAPPGQPKAAARTVIVRAQIVSGTRQTVHAYVAPAASTYLTDFALLVVQVGTPPRPRAKWRVRFHCETKDCVLAPTDQPNEGTYVHVVDSTTKDVDIVKGRATVRVVIESPRPERAYTVTATPIVKKFERAIPATFTLISR